VLAVEWKGFFRKCFVGDNVYILVTICHNLDCLVKPAFLLFRFLVLFISVTNIVLVQAGKRFVMVYFSKFSAHAMSLMDINPGFHIFVVL